VYTIRLGGVIIGHSALERMDVRNHAATGRLEPTGAFQQWQRLSEELSAAERAADQAAGSLEERRRNRELVAETLGWRVLDATPGLKPNPLMQPTNADGTWLTG
jgi:hypothetical protein